MMWLSRVQQCSSGVPQPGLALQPKSPAAKGYCFSQDAIVSWRLIHKPPGSAHRKRLLLVLQKSVQAKSGCTMSCSYHALCGPGHHLYLTTSAFCQVVLNRSNTSSMYEIRTAHWLSEDMFPHCIGWVWSTADPPDPLLRVKLWPRITFAQFSAPVPCVRVLLVSYLGVISCGAPFARS